MKNKIINIIGIVLIIAGIILIGITGYRKYETYQKQKALKEQFEKSMKDLGDNNKNKKEDEASPDGRPVGQDIKTIAMLVVPKLDLNVAVAESVDMDVLKYAIGHFPNTAKPGQPGNFALAGHRNFTYAEFFKNLDKLEKGDDLIIRTKEQEYKYKVTEKFIVDPDKVEVLDETKDATITLVTCTEGAKQRLIVKGKLEK
ncbi:sortase A [Clostridium cavendishii DSM 21758]|uniref:Sortase A n=1 Tax=Clostridium cavendishii DSM 21758 TaxID=1121302 RepID=A0A1M6LSX7_9CLOT|nr:class D sortase [Clostridium cavendishii]SHJ74202.1 sortase A [Clostridium cavendishii DSM 21758]